MFKNLFSKTIKYEKKGNNQLVLLNGGNDSFIKNEKTGEISYNLFPMNFIGANISGFEVVDRKQKVTYVMH